MDQALEQVKHTLETVITDVENHFRQLLDEQQTKHENMIIELQKELGELRSYKDVSLVNKLTVQIDQLQTENLQLKKRLRSGTLGTQSTYTATTVAPTVTTQSQPTMKVQVAKPQVEPVPRLKPSGKAPTVAPKQAKEEPKQEPVQPELKEESEEEPQSEEPEQPEEEPQSEEPEEEPQSEEPEQPVPEPQSEEPEPEPEPDLFLLDNLVSGRYFWEPESGNLYERISDEEAGDIVGKIKTIKVRDHYYYQDTIDNHVYQYVEDTGDIGEKCGRIVNGKFVKN